MPRVAILVLLALGVALTTPAGGCAVEDQELGCARLERFSCGCFPECLQADEPAIDRDDADACNTRLREHYDEYAACSERSCEGGCQFGWSRCALEIYEEVGLAALAGATTCGVDLNAGADAGALEDGGD